MTTRPAHADVRAFPLWSMTCVGLTGCGLGWFRFEWVEVRDDPDFRPVRVGMPGQRAVVTWSRARQQVKYSLKRTGTPSALAGPQQMSWGKKT